MRGLLVLFSALLQSTIASAQSRAEGFADLAALSYTDQTMLTLKAGLSGRLTPDRGLGAAVGAYAPDAGADLAHITLRGFRSLGEKGTIGLFAGQDSAKAQTHQMAGFEFAYLHENTRFEGYYGALRSHTIPSDITQTLGGLRAEVRFGSDFHLSFVTDAYDQNGPSVTERVSTASLGARMRMTKNSAVFARYGSTTSETVVDGTITQDLVRGFFSLGAEIAFGTDTALMLRPRSHVAAFGY